MMTRKASTNDSLLDDAIRSVRDGNTAAFEVVVRQLERPLRAWLAVQAPPGVDVDEVAQRSFVAAFTRLGDYELGTNFAAWLFTIARFHLKTEVSHLRRIADYHVRYAPDFLHRELERHFEVVPETGESLDVELRLEDFRPQEKELTEKCPEGFPASPVGLELFDWWCCTINEDAGLEITHVELDTGIIEPNILPDDQQM